jgi:hypothetical protein
MRKLAQYVRKHFSCLAENEKWPFLWRTWLEAVLLAYIVANIVTFFFPAGPRSDLAQMTLWGLLGLVLIVGPLFETLAFQCLPWEFTSTLRVRRSLRFLLSVVPFALAHHFAGMPTVLAAGIVGGFYFAFTYERWRKESLVVAVVMTFLLHSSFNLVGVLGMLLLPR